MSKTDREKAEKTDKSIQREVVWAQGIFKLTGNSVFQAIRHYVEKALKEAKREVLESEYCRHRQSCKKNTIDELSDEYLDCSCGFDKYKKEVLGE